MFKPPSAVDSICIGREVRLPLSKIFYLVMKSIINALLLATTVTWTACESGPKVIEAENTASQNETPIFQEAGTSADGHNHGPAMDSEEHEVLVEEVLPTERYTYLRVTENGEEYWLAISKREVKKGSKGYYRGGLVKRNFQSKEYNRIFETLYLVADYRDGSTTTGNATLPSASEALDAPKSVLTAPGAIKIADLVANLQKYNGKTVKVTGKCVKINPMIMGRNWLHLQDGSGKNLDLTVTTNANVPLGAVVTMEGVLATGKDFGAGYKYDYIVENAVVVQ